MKTEFSLNDLLDAYHVKCRELEHIRRIKDLLTDQNEKLIKSNFESEKVKELETELSLLRVKHIELGKNRNVHLNRKIKLYEQRKELKTEIAVLQAHIEEQEDYKNELVKIWQDSHDKLIKELHESNARVKELEERINPHQYSGINSGYDSNNNDVVVPSNDSNRYEPTIKWDDYKTGG